MKLGIALGTAMVFGACAACASHVVPAEDPNNYDPSLVSCDSACMNLHRLKCESGSSVAKCLTFCARVQRSGYLTLPLSCVVHAQSKAEVRVCGARCSGD